MGPPLVGACNVHLGCASACSGSGGAHANAANGWHAQIVERGCALLGYAPIGNMGMLLLATRLRSAAMLPGGHVIKLVTESRWLQLPLEARLQPTPCLPCTSPGAHACATLQACSFLAVILPSLHAGRDSLCCLRKSWDARRFPEVKVCQLFLYGRTTDPGAAGCLYRSRGSV